MIANYAAWGKQSNWLINRLVWMKKKGAHIPFNSSLRNDENVMRIGGPRIYKQYLRFFKQIESNKDYTTKG